MLGDKIKHFLENFEDYCDCGYAPTEEVKELLELQENTEDYIELLERLMEEEE